VMLIEGTTVVGVVASYCRCARATRYARGGRVGTSARQRVIAYQST
jgi:hypothetical protein